VFDERTNLLFVQDVPIRLEEVRKVITQVDIPVRQVMIEARIVEATDQFARNLGARLGAFRFNGRNHGYGGGNLDTLRANNLIAKSPGKFDSLGNYTPPEYEMPTFPGLNQVNLPATPFQGVSPTEFSFILFNSARTRFLNSRFLRLRPI